MSPVTSSRRRPRPVQGDDHPPSATSGEGEHAGAPGTGLVTKALNLIDLIAAAPGRHRAQSLADELGLPRSTVYRIIATLQQRGLVRSDTGAQGYYPGFRFLDYAQAVWPVPDLPLLAMAELRWLRDLTGETVYFGVPAGQDMVIIQKAESRFPLRNAAALGSRRPLHASGMGKAHLSALPTAEREALLTRIPMERFTPRTIADPVQLRAQLDVYRLRGYAIDEEEFMEGARCVSAAVLGEGDASLGAFTISGPVYRMTQERAHQLGPEVAAAARRLGESVRRRTSTRTRVRPGTPQAPLLGEATSFFGKSPAWDGTIGRLLWLDALAPALLAQGEAGGSPPALVAGFGSPAMALAALEPGRWFVVTADGPAMVEADGTAGPCPTPLPDGIAPLVTCAVSGDADRIWLGLGDAQGSAVGPGLGLLDHHGFRRIADLAVAPTDLAWDNDGRNLYVALSDAGEIACFPASATGDLGPPRSVAHVDPIHGRPFGLLLEDPGTLWVALWDGWSIARMSRNGDDMRLLPLPVPRPTGLAWGGAEGSTLYVTSARRGLAPQQIAEAPASGGVFVLEPGLRAALLR